MIDDPKRNKLGIGLGLYISKQLSKRLSYKNYKGISVQSQYHSGSTFSFILEDKNPLRSINEGEVLSQDALQ